MNKYKLRINPKVICAGSLLLICTASSAQSSVTIYGLLDTAILWTNKTVNLANGTVGGHQISLVSGGYAPSRFGITGAEDLGGGLKAIFKLESGLNIANGGFSDSNGNMFGRQAWIGLSGNFGKIQAGLQASPFVMNLIETDLRNASYFGSLVPIYAGSVAATGMFNANAISYASPKIAGLEGSVMLALGGAAGDFQAGRQYSARLKYSIGQLVVDTAMYSGNAGGSAATTPVPTTVPFDGRTIDVIYNFESLAIKATYTSLDVEGSYDRRTFGVGFNYRWTPAFNVDYGIWYTSDGDDPSSHTLSTAVGLTYSLSKTTALYTQFAYLDNHGKSNIGISANGSLLGAPGANFGADVGIRHSF